MIFIIEILGEPDRRGKARVIERRTHTGPTISEALRTARANLRTPPPSAYSFSMKANGKEVGRGGGAVTATKPTFWLTLNQESLRHTQTTIYKVIGFCLFSLLGLYVTCHLITRDRQLETARSRSPVQSCALGRDQRQKPAFAPAQAPRRGHGLRSAGTAALSDTRGCRRDRAASDSRASRAAISRLAGQARRALTNRA